MALENEKAPAVEAPRTVRAKGASTRLLWVIFGIAAAMQLVRICQVESKSGEVPFFSANDRSRWCTIAALAASGSYEIDDLLFEDDDQRRRTPWYSIDLVRHQGSDGQLHYYSSKPPLLPTLYAGVYWGIRQVTGLTLASDTFLVARIILVLVNLVPLIWFWFYWARNFSSEGGEDDWASVIAAGVLAFGTFLSTFASTLNNHLPAGIAVGCSLVCVHRVLIGKDERLRNFVLAGLCTSFGAANELPALSWVAAVGAMLLIVEPVKTLVGYLPALVPVAVAFFGLNYLAHGEFAPAYAHRSAGELLFVLDIEPGTEHLSMERIVRGIESQGIDCSESCSVRPARRANTFEFLDLEKQSQLALIISDDQQQLAVHRWGDWYDYPGSYWAGEKQGVDRGEPSRGWYIFHCLIGHHGVFSLTPFWLLSIFGAILIFIYRDSLNFVRDHRWLLCLAILATTVVVLGFYFSRSLEDRNYGGVSSGFRWAFWMIPMWLWLALPAIERIKSSWGRRTVELAVVASVFSATFPWRNPWTSPWLMQLGEYLGWIS